MKVIVLEIESLEEEKRLEEFLKSLDKAEKKSNSTRTQLNDSRIRNVDNFLNNIGIKTNLMGYYYIKETVLKLLEDGSTFDIGVTKCLYPYLAKKFNTSPTRVERAIRNAIETTWKRGNQELLKNMFPYAQECRPTNSEFLSKISNEMQLAEFEEKK